MFQAPPSGFKTPAGTAYVFDTRAAARTGDPEYWIGNWHIIRVDGLEVTGRPTKRCVEVGKQHACPLLDPPQPKTYHLKYTVEWTPDVELVDAVYLSNARAGARPTGCPVTFDVPESSPGSGPYRVSYSRLAPFDFEVIAVVGHLHQGESTSRSRWTASSSARPIRFTAVAET